MAEEAGSDGASVAGTESVRDGERQDTTER